MDTANLITYWEAMLHAVIKEWRAMVIPSINKLRDMTKAETIFLGLRS